MATKRYTPLDDPPSASSDDDETEDEQEIITQKLIHESESSSEEGEEEEEVEVEDEDEDEDEEEEETPKPTKNLHIENPKIPNPNSKPEFSSEDEPGSNSDREETHDSVKVPIGIPKTKTLSLNSSSTFEFDSDVKSPTASDFSVKPSKKIEKTPTSKRLNSGSESKDKRKKIKVSNGEIDDEKKAVSKRVWTIEDELLLLQGFIDYQSKIGCSPLSDMDGFYQFAMGSLPGYATKSQLYEKVRRLKKKFRVVTEKFSGTVGGDPVFNKPHERNLYELSNKIWGIDGCENVVGVGGSNAKAKVRVSKVKPKEVKPKEVKLKEVKSKVEVNEKDEDDEKVVKVEDFEMLYPFWNAGLSSEVSSALKFPDGVVNLVKENLSLIGEDKAKEMNEKWEALFENEAVLRKRRIALLSNIGDVETA